MSNPMIAPLVAAAIAIAGLTAAQTPPPEAPATPMSKHGYTAAKKASDDQYNINKVACKSLFGNAKDICLKEAKAALVRAKADAKVDGVAVDARQLAVEKATEARMEDNDDKRDAEYSLAVERCGSLEGAAKDACLGNAKLRYGKS
jgi:hypothetical protein